MFQTERSELTLEEWRWRAHIYLQLAVFKALSFKMNPQHLTSRSAGLFFITSFVSLVFVGLIFPHLLSNTNARYKFAFYCFKNQHSIKNCLFYSPMSSFGARIGCRTYKRGFVYPLLWLHATWKDLEVQPRDHYPRDNLSCSNWWKAPKLSIGFPDLPRGPVSGCEDWEWVLFQKITKKKSVGIGFTIQCNATIVTQSVYDCTRDVYCARYF